MLEPMTTFSISEALKVGWEKTRKNFWLWVALLLTTFVVHWVLTTINDRIENTALGLLMLAVSLFVQITLELGLMWIALKLIDNQPVTYTDLFKMYPSAGHSLFATVIAGIMVVLGLIVFIVPGVIIAMRLSQTGFLIVEWRMSGVAALKKSWEITRGHTLQLFFLTLVICVLNILGAIAVLIGLLVTIPMTTLAMAYVYRKIAPGGALMVAPVSDLAPTAAVA